MFDPSTLLAPVSGKPILPTTTRLFDALRVAERQLIELRTANDTEKLGATLRRIGQLKLMLGETEALPEMFQESEMLIGSSTRMHLELGCALCYIGYYNRGKNRLEQAYKRNPTDELTRGNFYAAMGLLYYRDQGRYDEAASQLNYALETLGDSQFYARSAVLVGQAEVSMLRGAHEQAQVWLEKADEFLTSHKVFWYRPAYYAVSSRLALALKDATRATLLARKGLGAVDDRGDLRALPGLYRLLAAGMERNPELLDHARDARQRSVTAARARAPRIELAHALYELGQHHKLYYRRITQQARGAGFLFEAEQIYRELGVPVPG